MRIPCTYLANIELSGLSDIWIRVVSRRKEVRERLDIHRYASSSVVLCLWETYCGGSMRTRRRERYVKGAGGYLRKKALQQIFGLATRYAPHMSLQPT